MTRCFPEVNEGLVDDFGIDFFQSGGGDFQAGLWSVEDRLIVYGFGDGCGEVFRFACVFAFHSFSVGIQQIGFRFGEFGLGESVLECAAEFLFEKRNGLLPAIVCGGDGDRAEFDIVEKFVL